MFEHSKDFLYPFYAHAIQAITGVRDGLPDCTEGKVSPACAYVDLGVHDTRHMFFVEPIAVRNQLDFALQASVPFTNYSNLVYSPHQYTHVFTLDRMFNLPLNTTIYPPGGSYDFALQTATKEANGTAGKEWNAMERNRMEYNPESV